MLKLPLRIAWMILRAWWRIAMVLCIAVVAVMFFQMTIARRTLRAVGR